MKRKGVADLPLHSGKCPRWLFEKMKKLAKAVVEVLVYEYGTNEFLKRISNPHWFQCFACVLGFDWHSSGTTTTTCGALKEALSPEEHGIAVAGGKGRASRKAPKEIENACKVFSFSTRRTEELKKKSLLVAKIDNACIQDGYELYHHVFILTEKGEWAVIQQGMKGNYARRYHWLSFNIRDIVEEPHSGICSERLESKVMDLTSRISRETRKASLDIVKENPRFVVRYFKHQYGLEDYLYLPPRHRILDVDLDKRSLKVLLRAYEIQPSTYEELLCIRGMGPKKIRALSLIAQLLYGTEISWRDPAKFSFAHGGKDGYPYPVDMETYENSISILREAISQAEVDRKERLLALRRLEKLTADKF